MAEKPAAGYSTLDEMADDLRNFDPAEMPKEDPTSAEMPEGGSALAQATALPTITLWMTETGEEIDVMDTIAAECLRWKHPADHKMAGMPIYSIDPMEPKLGPMVCTLHLDSPFRDQADMMGLPMCTKTGFFNRFQITQHMMLVHETSYEAIKEETSHIERQKLLEAQIAQGEKQTELIQNVRDVVVATRSME